jgi:hypothetical protein
MKLSNKEQDMINRLNKYVNTVSVSNAFLIQLIELAGDHLNINTIPNYAKIHGKSYNGVKNNRNIIELFKVKFVIDNK